MTLSESSGGISSFTPNPAGVALEIKWCRNVNMKSRKTSRLLLHFFPSIYLWNKLQFVFVNKVCEKILFSFFVIFIFVVVKIKNILFFLSPPTPLHPHSPVSFSAPPPPLVKMKRRRWWRRSAVCPAMRALPINTLCYANLATRRPAAIGCQGESVAFCSRSAQSGERLLTCFFFIIIYFSSVFFFFDRSRFATRDWNEEKCSLDIRKIYNKSASRTMQPFQRRSPLCAICNLTAGFSAVAASG